MRQTGFLIFCLLFNLPAIAQQHEPDIHWQTLQSSHFCIHYPDHFDLLAEKIALLCEEIYEPISSSLHYFPKQTHVVLHTRTDFSNGLTAPLPWRMELFVTEPQDNLLGGKDDWLRLLVTHEFAHIVHLRKNRGLSRLTYPFFGELNSFWQALTPAWFIEGFATLSETRFTQGGRGRNATHFMEMAAPVAANRPWQLANTNYISRKKLPIAMYYVSGYFLANFIQQKYGREVWADILDQYSSLPIWGFNRAVKKTTGKSEQQHYRDLLRKFPAFTSRDSTLLVSPEILLPEGIEQSIDEYLLQRIPEHWTSPRWLTNNRILFYRTGFDELPAIVSADKDGKTCEILKRALTNEFNSFAARGNILVWTELKTDPQFSATVYSDVKLMELTTKKIHRLTHNARITTLDLSPDQQKIVAVQNEADQTILVKIELATGKIEAILKIPDFEFLNPRWSPDGQSVVFSLRDSIGNENISVFDCEKKSWRYLYEPDKHDDNNPCWSQDSRFVFYNSDRSGLFNIWAVDVQTGQRWQVTDASLGAFSPAVSPDGNELAYSLYTYSGFVVATQPINSQDWRQIESTQPIELPVGLRASENNVVKISPPPDLFTRKTGYSPWSQILRPQGWLPLIYERDDSYAPAFAVISEDVLHRHSWQGIIGYFPETRRPFFNFDYRYSRYWPRFGLNAYNLPEKVAFRDFTGWWQQQGFILSMVFPLLLESNVNTTILQPFVGFKYENQKHATGGLFPRYNHYRGLKAGLSFYRGNQTLRDVVPHRLISFLGTYDWTNPALNSQYDGHQLSAQFNFYVPTFVRHHQLQLLTSYQARCGNYGFGYFGALPLGYNDDGYRQQFRFKLGYHFPVAYLEWPLLFLPVYLDYISAAVFHDWGTSWNHGLGSSRWGERGRYSAGIQMNLLSNVFQYVPLQTGISVFYHSMDQTWQLEPYISVNFYY